MLLLREVDRNPHEEFSESYCTVIDEVLALCRPEGGVTGAQEGSLPRILTEGGQEAWDLIKRFRSRIWTRSGLDPDVLPRRDEIAALAEERLEELTSLSSDQQSEPVQALGLDDDRYRDGDFDAGAGTTESFTPNLNWDALFGEMDPLGSSYGFS
jgi:hypothetical protein